MRYSNGYFWLPQNVCYCNENSLQKARSKNHSIQKLQNFHEQSLKFELNNELLKTDINPFAPCAPLDGWKYRPTFEQLYLENGNSKYTFTRTLASQKSSFPIFPVERVSNAELKEFNEFFFKVLEKHAPRKQKYIRANNSNYITKALWKEIMHRSQLRNKFLREREQMNLRLPITNNEMSAV